jgi:SRSO17 transposase
MVSEGTKGPIEYEFTQKRVVLAKYGLPEKEVWLLIRKTLDAEPKYSYFVSNAPASCRLKILAWLSGIRWAIEQCFEEAKTEIGMDHYEVQKLPG